jgi:hypothetical protein
MSLLVFQAALNFALLASLCIIERRNSLALNGHFDLARSIHGVADSLRPSIAAKGQHLTLSLPVKHELAAADREGALLPPVFADHDRVTQILRPKEKFRARITTQTNFSESAAALFVATVVPTVNYQQQWLGE